MDPIYFSSAEEFEAWLIANHEQGKELLLGFHKTKSATKGITYGEARDLALVFGWIDAVRKSVDANRYTIRFTPRKKRSIWSQVNIKRVAELTAEGRMRPAGTRIFEERDQSLERTYFFEKEPMDLSAEYEKTFRGNAEAWVFFTAQPAYYRNQMIHRVMTAKQEETRLRRLNNLVLASAEKKRLL